MALGWYGGCDGWGNDMSEPLLWKDENTQMIWDHFSWDALASDSSVINPMKPLKIGLAKPDPIVLSLTDSIVAGATGDATLTNSPVTLAVLGTLRTAGGDAITDEVQAKETGWPNGARARRRCGKCAWR
jgi:hypothetical protein